MKRLVVVCAVMLCGVTARADILKNIPYNKGPIEVSQWLLNQETSLRINNYSVWLSPNFTPNLRLVSLSVWLAGQINASECKAIGSGLFADAEFIPLDKEQIEEGQLLSIFRKRDRITVSFERSGCNLFFYGG